MVGTFRYGRLMLLLFCSILNVPRYQRYIGVIYRPRSELASHYSRGKAAEQYDAIAIVKRSRGIQPLEREDSWKGERRGDIELTFPFGY